MNETDLIINNMIPNISWIKKEIMSEIKTINEKLKDCADENFKNSQNEMERSNYAKYIIVNFNHTQKDSPVNL